MEYNPMLKELIQSHYEDLEVKDYELFKVRQFIKLSVIPQFFPPDFAATGQLIDELVRHLEKQGVDIEVYPSSVTLREGERYKPYQAINTSYTIRKKMVLYLLLEKNLAIASCAKALELRNGKCFRRVTEEGYTGQPAYAFQTPCAPCVEQSGRVKIKRSRTTQFWSDRIRGKAVNGVLFTLRAALYLLNAARRRNVVLLTTAPPFLPILGYMAHVLCGLNYVCILYDNKHSILNKYL